MAGVGLAREVIAIDPSHARGLPASLLTKGLGFAACPHAHNWERALAAALACCVGCAAYLAPCGSRPLFRSAPAKGPD
jgi:hypothetical protein